MLCQEPLWMTTHTNLQLVLLCYAPRGTHPKTMMRTSGKPSRRILLSRACMIKSWKQKKQLKTLLPSSLFTAKGTSTSLFLLTIKQDSLKCFPNNWDSIPNSNKGVSDSLGCANFHPLRPRLPVCIIWLWGTLQTVEPQAEEILALPSSNKPQREGIPQCESEKLHMWQ